MLLASAVIADDGVIETYTPNQAFIIPVHLTNSSGNVVGANCSAQIRSSNFSVIANIVMQETSGGWYNASYSNSVAGYYFCSTNCTQGPQYTGGGCNFLIESDSMTPEAIAISMLFFAILLAIVMVILGLYVEDSSLISIGGVILSLAGAYIWLNGFGTLSDKLSIGIGLVLLAIGGYLFLRPILEETINKLNEMK